MFLWLWKRLQFYHGHETWIYSYNLMAKLYIWVQKEVLRSQILWVVGVGMTNKLLWLRNVLGTHHHVGEPNCNYSQVHIISTKSFSSGAVDDHRSILYCHPDILTSWTSAGVEHCRLLHNEDNCFVSGSQPFEAHKSLHNQGFPTNSHIRWTIMPIMVFFYTRLWLSAVTDICSVITALHHTTSFYVPNRQVIILPAASSLSVNSLVR